MAEVSYASITHAHCLSAQLGGQPVVLIEADPGREGEVGAEPDKHPPPEAIVHVEVVLDDPVMMP